ncbi:MAG: DUF4331 domain-containing protein, partial [Acidobacteriota bacterium]|nr:DUF4331 domain-containing protein [Acidobacteriota bacterium]
MKKFLLEKSLKMTRIFLVLALCFGLSGLRVLASSHTEAPLIAMDRYADNTDVYAFRSLEPGREGFVTIIANFIPFQDPSGGPHFYRFDDTVLYEIKIDNTGDGREDITYQFQFGKRISNSATVFGQNTINQDGVITSLTDPDYNEQGFYDVRRIDSGTGPAGRSVGVGFQMPPENIGPRVTPNYEANLAQRAIYPLDNSLGRVFVGQRDESFFIDVGGVFDAFNLRSLGANGGVDSLRTKNISTIALEIPIEELTRNGRVPTGPTDPNAVIGVFSTASRRSMQVLSAGKRDSSGPFRQVSRLGNPLVNEVVIPLALKDAFNSLSPVGDAVAAPAILDPELPKLIQTALSVYGDFNGNKINLTIPPAPRNDLVAIFATGIPAGAVPGAPTYTTFLSDGQPHEYLRLNTAIPVTPLGSAGFSRLGLLGNDLAGFPNGRRPQDDVVDIELRALLGGTPFTPATNVAPNNAVGDGVAANFEGFLNRFPYL